jgi:hypothetical protein
MCVEPAQITSTNPGSSPSRAAPRTLTDVRLAGSLTDSGFGAGRGCQCGEVGRAVGSSVVLGYPQCVHRRLYLARGQTDLGDDTPVARSLELIQT